MGVRAKFAWTGGLALVVAAGLGFVAPDGLHAAPGAIPAEVTFTKHIAPILQRSCENCHRADGVAPMSLVTYEDVRPWARAIKQRTGIGPRAGVMPPWYVERNIGIQKFHNDPSLSEDEIATVAKWADSGAPRGNPADMPPAKVYADEHAWAIGTPDLVIKTQELEVKGDAADWWGEIPSVPTGLTEDRYVAALEIKEVNDVGTKSGSNRATVGGRFVFHHMIWRTQVLDPNSDQPPDALSILTDEEAVNWPVHEVGRNADFFDPKSARLLKAGSSIFRLGHLHSNGRDTRRTRRLLLMPKGYKPTHKRAVSASATGWTSTSRRWSGARLHRVAAAQDHLFEPHLHAPGPHARGDPGYTIQTLNRVATTTPARLRLHRRLVAAAPKGTILHIVGHGHSADQERADPTAEKLRQPVLAMFVHLGRVACNEQPGDGEAARNLKLTKNDVVIGCPLCW